MSKLDLVNWTMREARQLSPEHHMDSEVERSPALNNLLEVLEGERGELSPEGIRSISVHSVQLTVGSPIISPSPEPLRGHKPDAASGLPAHTTISGLVGLIWRVRDNLSFDVGLRHALINGHPVNEVRAGLTFGFPLGQFDGRPAQSR